MSQSISSHSQNLALPPRVGSTGQSSHTPFLDTHLVLPLGISIHKYFVEMVFDTAVSSGCGIIIWMCGYDTSKSQRSYIL